MAESCTWHCWTPVMDQRPISPMIFHRNSNFMEISFCSHPSCSEMIAMEFCTWQDSCAVMACAKFCSDVIPYNRVTLKQIFYRIWITIWKNGSWNEYQLMGSKDEVVSLKTKYNHNSKLCFHVIWFEGTSVEVFVQSETCDTSDMLCIIVEW